MNAKAIGRALEIPAVISCDEMERIVYLNRVRVERDETSRRKAAEREKAEALKTGRAEVLSQGLNQDIAKSLSPGSRMKLGGPPQPALLGDNDRIEQSDELLDLLRRLYGDIIPKDFFAQFREGK